MSALNTDKNVYILGAGFSKELGLPLQDDFILIATSSTITSSGHSLIKASLLCSDFM